MLFHTKSYILLSLMALTALLGNYEVSAQSSSCTYTSLTGETHTIPFDAAAGKSVEYADYGTNTDGICIQRAKCNKRLETEVRKCTDLRITCENRKLFEGDFPACCIKC